MPSQNKKISLDKAKRIFTFFRPYLKLWLFLFSISLILTVLGLANPLIVKFLIDDVLIAKDLGLLRILMFVFIGITIFSTVISVFYSYFYKKLELSILYDVRNKLFEHLEELDQGFFRKKKMGDILMRLGSDISGIERFISLIFNGLIKSFFTLIFILAISLYLNWKMTLLVITTIPLYVISQRYYAGKLRNFYRALKRQSAALMSFLEEKLSAIALVQLFGREEYELEREKHRMKRLIDTGLKTTLISTYAGTIIGLITFCALLFVLWFGGYQVIIGVMTLGSLIAIYSYLGGLFGPIETLASIYTAAQSPLASADRVFQILDTKSKVKEKKGAQSMPLIKGEVVFDNVSFAYNLEPILKNVSFKVKPGEVIGIVGASGSGKTTIANLISRFYDPNNGKVLIDGRDIKSVNIQSLRRQIGLVRQNTILFNASVKENLTYGHFGTMSLSEIKTAAREARIDNVIEALPRQYKTVLGEKGMTLSGGERQRFSIARNILKNPEVIILDEATSFLDFETELYVMQNLNRVFAGKTMFIIAHRLSSLEDVDRILVLKDGSITEEGSFKELLDKKGEFFRMYNYQIGGFSRFEEKLKNELERAKLQNLPLSAIGLSIKNIIDLIQDRGEREVVRVLDHVLTEISTFLPSPYFSTQDQNQKELFYIILPETDKTKAEGVSSSLTSHLIKRFPEIEIDVKIVLATSKTGDTVNQFLKEINPHII